MAAAWDRLLRQEMTCEPVKVEIPFTSDSGEGPSLLKPTPGTRDNIRRRLERYAADPKAKANRSQQGFDTSDVPANPYKHEPRKPILVTRFSKEERARIDLLYRKNVALIKFITAKMNRKFGSFVELDTIKSLSQIAFLKTARIWDPNRGKFSTAFALFFQGEILHWVRSSNWGIRADHAKRALGCKARSMLNKGLTVAEVQQQLEISSEELKLALQATSGIDHDIKGFDLHLSTYKTPMELAEEEEETQAMRERLIALSAQRFGLTEVQAEAFVKQKLQQVEIFGVC